MSTGATCMLRVVRGSGFADRFRRYNIFINGAQAGTIARDEVLDLEVPCGPLTIEARIDWGRSQPLTIGATPDQRIEVRRYQTIGGLCLLSGASHLVFVAI